MSADSTPATDRSAQPEKVQSLPLDLILSDGSTQTRANLSPQAIKEYADLILAGNEMDPAIVFFDGENHWLSAGFHRREAYRAANRVSMPCIVRPGTRWDAICEGISDNLRHRGERLTTADKKHNIGLVLREKPEMTDRAIAELVGVSHTTVARHRSDLQASGLIDQSSQRIGRDGRAYQSPESKAFDEAWELHPPPELPQYKSLYTFGPDGRMASIDPHERCPGYWYLSILPSLDHGGPLVVLNPRGTKLSRDLAESYLKEYGFQPSGPWHAGQVSDGPPCWITECFPRWVQWSQDFAKGCYWRRHGNLPELSDQQFWGEFNALIEEAAAAVPTPEGGDTGESGTAKWDFFYAAWQAKYGSVAAA